MSTYLELCNKLRDLTGITGSSLNTTVSQTGMNKKITLFIADADEWLQKLYSDWKFLAETAIITTVSGTDEYTLSDLSITDLNIWDKDNFFINPGTADYRKLNNLLYDTWRKSNYRLGVKVSAEPTEFVIKPDNSLVFIDKPNAAYTIWADYYKKPARMTADDSTSSIPAQFEMAIIHKAKMYQAEYFEDVSLYNSAKSDFVVEFDSLCANQLPYRSEKNISSNNPEEFRIVVV